MSAGALWCQKSSGNTDWVKNVRWSRRIEHRSSSPTPTPLYASRARRQEEVIIKSQRYKLRLYLSNSTGSLISIREVLGYWLHMLWWDRLCLCSRWVNVTAAHTPDDVIRARRQRRVRDILASLAECLITEIWATRSIIIGTQENLKSAKLVLLPGALCVMSACSDGQSGWNSACASSSCLSNVSGLHPNTSITKKK